LILIFSLFAARRAIAIIDIISLLLLFTFDIIFAIYAMPLPCR